MDGIAAAIEAVEQMRNDIAETRLTKREQFAMAAMQGLLAADKDREITYEDAAMWGVRHADYLLEELSK